MLDCRPCRPKGPPECPQLSHISLAPPRPPPPLQVRTHPVLLGECLGGALYTQDFIRLCRQVGRGSMLRSAPRFAHPQDPQGRSRQTRPCRIGARPVMACDCVLP